MSRLRATIESACIGAPVVGRGEDELLERVVAGRNPVGNIVIRIVHNDQRAESIQ